MSAIDPLTAIVHALQVDGGRTPEEAIAIVAAYETEVIQAYAAAPTRIRSFATCQRCQVLRSCLHVAGVPLCDECRALTESEVAS